LKIAVPLEKTYRLIEQFIATTLTGIRARPGFPLVCCWSAQHICSLANDSFLTELEPFQSRGGLSADTVHCSAKYHYLIGEVSSDCGAEVATGQRRMLSGGIQTAIAYRLTAVWSWGDA
jgi:hypothetical protein